jgi:hypothetical protein
VSSNKVLKCDACHIADAYVIAHKDRRVLLFCIHHAMQHMEVLRANGWILLHKEAKSK